MSLLTLVIYLDHVSDGPTLRTTLENLETSMKLNLLKRDGVILLSENVALFDETEAHDVLTRSCSELLSRDKPYLVVHIESSSALTVGTPPKEAQAGLAKYGIPICTTPTSGKPS